MNSVDVVVVTPFDVGSGRGNSVSARRIGGVAESLGLSVAVMGGGDEIVDGKVLVALHARRSRVAIERFGKLYPGRKRVVVLTGSDLHIDLPTAGEAAATVLETMELADVLVLAQAGSVAAVPERFRGKLTVVPKSVDIGLPDFEPPARTGGLRGVIAAHLRPLKDPFCAVEALGQTGVEVAVRIDHYGAVQDGEMRARAEWESARNRRYHWHGEVSRARMVAEMGKCHLHLNTALMEGGANSVCEAIGIGVPVVATCIPGNVGMLGEGYQGYFEVGDTLALAGLLRRCWADFDFWEGLRRQVVARSKLFTREQEMAGWKLVLGGDLAFQTMVD
ncbi:MAG: hypothetical protein P8J87_10680 [Verrucomicrobiales bacterium]|nr:hypothetical protein [Verrucomicrobiales bacterium]